LPNRKSRKPSALSLAAIGRRATRAESVSRATRPRSDLWTSSKSPGSSLWSLDCSGPARPLRHRCGRRSTLHWRPGTENGRRNRSKSLESLRCHPESRNAGPRFFFPGGLAGPARGVFLFTRRNFFQVMEGFFMLVLQHRQNQVVRIGEAITVVLFKRNGHLRIGIDAPRELAITREMQLPPPRQRRQQPQRQRPQHQARAKENGDVRGIRGRRSARSE